MMRGREELARIARAWYGPAALAGAFILAFGAMLWVLQQRVDRERLDSLPADVELARQSLRSRLESNRDYLVLLAQDHVRGTLDEVAFQERATRFAADHPEIHNVLWAGPDFVIHRVAPVDPGTRPVGAELALPERKRAARLAAESQGPAYTRPFADPKGRFVFEIWIPAYREGSLSGLFAVAYSCERLLRHAPPALVLRDYRLTLLDDRGAVIAETPATEPVDARLAHHAPLDPPGHGTRLRLQHYGTGALGWGLTLLGLACAGLALGMAYGMYALKRDIARRRLAEEARDRLEEQLRESQKMEAVGRLAGGIAHQFNNLLTAVTGYSDLLLHRLAESDPVRNDIEVIKRAGERAASLTGQLLAFGRRQMLQPRVLDLNAVVGRMEKMLRRVLGEEIRLVFVPGDGLFRVRADPVQIEQVLLELAENARTAMPEGGTLRIETANVPPDVPQSPGQDSRTGGRFAMIAVSDTGCGMDEETLRRVFEPFFTTKETGKGTGLGLATVFGIVTQSGGRIEAESEAGTGSTFRIYLPGTEEAAEAAEAGTALRAPRGRETVLLVDDEELVRSLVRTILTKDGYTVLEAPDGDEALRISDARRGPIDLMVTDVVMPRMSGLELAERLADRRPGMKVLFMSGFSEGELARQGVRAEGTAFIRKPFSPMALARTVREMLDLP